MYEQRLFRGVSDEGQEKVAKLRYEQEACHA